MAFFIIGLLATVFMDIWAFCIRIVFSIKGLDYRLLGRWVLYFKRGQFIHRSIINSKKQPYELFIGYFTHYLIGGSLTIFLQIVTGKEWLDSPDFLTAILFGLITTIAPFLIMQPAFGFGFFCRKLDNQMLLIVKSLMAHVSYGVGLYFAALFVSIF